MKVAVCTWNAAQLLHKHHASDFTACLSAHNVGQDSDLTASEAPAIYVIGFQETTPLPAALAGAPAAKLDRLDQQLKVELEKHASSQNASTKYVLARKATLGGLALFVYVAEGFTSQVCDVQAADTAFGAYYMCNKGAVGIRFKLRDSNTIWTFVNTHLAPHDYNVARRNDDWKSIVSRLLFRDGRKASQIYDSSYLFVLGDLNYRISTAKPDYMSSLKLRSALSDRAKLIAERDQLSVERSARRTMHHLQEGDLASFPPSYKYRIGTNEYKSFVERTPGWCDRILFAAWSYDTIRQTGYSSIESVLLSDHKPVKASFDVTLPNQLSDATRSLNVKSPYGIDGNRFQRKVVGLILNKTIGIPWCLLFCAGSGNTVAGTILTFFSFASAWYSGVYWQAFSLIPFVSALVYAFGNLTSST